MITHKKHAASVALVMLFAASLFVSVPSSSAVFRQSITDLSAPSSVNAGEAFSVSITVRYDFTGEGEVTIFARVRDPSTGSEWPANGGSRRVQGVGDVTWDFQVVARNTPGLWRLEAYVIRQKGPQEVEDDKRGFTVTVREPTAGFDFSIKVSPSIVTMTPGEPASPTVAVGLVSGLAQQVSLTYMIPPLAGRDPGISASMSPTKGTPPFTSALKIATTTQTPPGTYTINVAGVSGSVQRTGTFTLAIVGPGAFDFSVTASPDSVSLRPGESASSALSTRLVTGPAQEVSFMYTVPQVVGVGASISPAKGTPPFTSTVRISTTAQTPPGTYVINMAAVGGGVEKRMSITLTVVAGGEPPPSGFDFSITVKPDSQSLRPEGSVVYDVYVDLEAGTSEIVSLTLSGLPEDATYAFDPPTGLPYFPSTLTVYVPQYTAAGAPMPAGTYTLTVAVEGDGLVRTATTMLVVQAAEVTTTQMAETSTQATLTSGPTFVATTQAATETTGSKGGLGERLGGGGIFLGLLIVAIAALAAYYIGKRRKQTSSRPGS
jgi:hypothetical protein